MGITNRSVQGQINHLDGKSEDSIITLSTDFGPNETREVLLAWQQCQDMPFIWRTWDCTGQCRDWTHKPTYEGGEWAVDDYRYPAFRYKDMEDHFESMDADELSFAHEFIEWLGTDADPRGDV